MTCIAWNRQVQHILASTFAGRCVVWDLRKNEPIIKVSDSMARVSAFIVFTTRGGGRGASRWISDSIAGRLQHHLGRCKVRLSKATVVSSQLLFQDKSSNTVKRVLLV